MVVFGSGGCADRSFHARGVHQEVQGLLLRVDADRLAPLAGPDESRPDLPAGVRQGRPLYRVRLEERNLSI